MITANVILKNHSDLEVDQYLIKQK